MGREQRAESVQSYNQLVAEGKTSLAVVTVPTQILSFIKFLAIKHTIIMILGKIVFGATTTFLTYGVQQ